MRSLNHFAALMCWSHNGILWSLSKAITFVLSCRTSVLILRCIPLYYAGLCFFWTVKIGLNSTIQRLIVCNRDTGHSGQIVWLLSIVASSRFKVAYWSQAIDFDLSSLLCNKLESQHENVIGWNSGFCNKKNLRQMQISIGRIRKRVFLEIHSQK